MSDEIKTRPIKGKINIQGKIKCKTGLFIGGLEESLDIGGIGSYIVRDPVTIEPYIPGSSFKGKMRYLMERIENKEFNKNSHSSGIYRHECDDLKCSVCRIFGAGEDGPASRIIFRDAFLTKESLKILDKIDTDMPFVEIKKENTIDRVTAQASPRTFERVPAGAEFVFEIIYTVETNNGEEKSDIFNLLSLLALLEDDAIGGNISRGYGQIEFKSINISAKPIEFYTNKKENIKQITMDCIKEYQEIRTELEDIMSF